VILALLHAVDIGLEHACYLQRSCGLCHRRLVTVWPVTYDWHRSAENRYGRGEATATTA